MSTMGRTHQEDYMEATIQQRGAGPRSQHKGLRRSESCQAPRLLDTLRYHQANDPEGGGGWHISLW